MYTYAVSIPAENDWNQGELIGRIFAYWAIVYFGQYFDNYVPKSSTFLGYFSPWLRLYME
jgi:hypothetical protein